MIDVIRGLADAGAGRGLYLYRAFGEEPVFYSYRELYGRVGACMDDFRAAGVGRDTRVLLQFETSIDVIASFLALIGAGAITFSVKPGDAGAGSESRAYLEFLCQRYHITHAVRPSLSGLRGLPATELVPPDRVAAEAIFAPAAPTDLALVQFSSGSTSLPKGIPVMRRTLEQQLGLIVGFDERRPSDVYVSWLPLYHDLGLVLGMLSSLYMRNDLHLISPFEFIREPYGWLDMLSQRRATHAVTPYFAINFCVNRLEREDPGAERGWSFEPLRSFLIGSDPIDFERTLEFQRRLEPYGFRRTALLPAYGMAEATLVVSATPLAKEPWAYTLPDGRKQISTGPLLPTFEARITREDGTVCADEELGEIELRGGTMVREYFEEPTIPFANADGYFATGDLGFMARSELFIAGRVGDRIKVNGQSLFSNDFEFAVQSVPFVKSGRAIVFQIDERIVMLAEAAGEAALRAPAEHKALLSDLVAQRLGVKLGPDDIHFIAPGQILKTTSGKPRRRAMAQAYLAGTIRMAEPQPLAASEPLTTTRPPTEVSYAR